MADNKKSLSGEISGKTVAKVFIVILGIAAVVLSYFLGYSSFMEQKASVDAETANLRSEIAVLTAMNEKQDEYIAEMSDIDNQVKYVERKFPSMIKAEDVIIYADALEKANDMQIASVSISEAELVYSTADVADEAVVEDTAADGEASGDAEPSEEENLKAEYAKYSITEDYYYDLYEVPVDYNFNVDYFNFKNAIRYIRSAADTQSIKNVVLSYNPETGELTGNLIVGDYVLTGSDGSYTAPSIPEVPVGTLNPFTGLGNDKVADEDQDAEATE